MTSVSSPELPFTPNIPLTTSSPVMRSETHGSFTSTTNKILFSPSMIPKPGIRNNDLLCTNKIIQ